MSEIERRMRTVFRTGALEQLARIIEEVDALRRGAADPATATSIPPRLRYLKGEASMVGLRPIAASLNAAEGRAAEAAWDAVAAALPALVRELEHDGGDAPAAAAPAAADAAPAAAEAVLAASSTPEVTSALRGWVKPDAIDELSDRLIELSTTYHRLSAGLVRAAGGVPDAPRDAIRELASDAAAARLQLDEVLGAAWSLRLTPVDELLERLAAHAAELSLSRGKSLKVQISGHAELERAMLEALEEPLLYVVREVVTHGIEEPEARGDKPAEATLALSARGDGGLVEIAVEDDGRGVEAAGVRARIERLGGTLAFDVRPGLGTRCVVALPDAIARERAVVVECGGGLFAVPADAVTGRLRLAEHARRRIARAAAIRIEDTWVPLGRLDEALGLSGAAAGTGADAAAGDGAAAAGPTANAAALVLEAGGRRRAFAVDRVDGEHELLRRPTSALSARHDVVVASSVTGDGRVVLWPSVLTLLCGARSSHARERRGSMPPRPPRPRRILVADDSPIVLEIVTSFLEGADLVTSTAPDGEEAWSALEAELPDLLLTDVDMPRLDGLGLLCRVRERWPRLPVIVLTTHDRDVDRRHAMSLGASAYIVKAELDEAHLLETVRGLIDAAEAPAVPSP